MKIAPRFVINRIDFVQTHRTFHSLFDQTEKFLDTFPLIYFNKVHGGDFNLIIFESLWSIFHNVMNIVNEIKCFYNQDFAAIKRGLFSYDLNKILFITQINNNDLFVFISNNIKYNMTLYIYRSCCFIFTIWENEIFSYYIDEKYYSALIGEHLSCYKHNNGLSHYLRSWWPNC